MAAFSTKRGGRIWLGIDKNGIPIGTQCKDDIDVHIQDLARVVKPPTNVSVKIIPHDAKKELFIVCLEIPEGKGIYCYKGVPYERRGETNYALTPDDIFDIQKDTKKIYFDEIRANCNERPALVSDIDIKKIEKYYEMRGKGKTEGFNLTRFLTNHDLLIDATLQVKNAAVMLFGKEPNRFIPQCKIRYCQFPSDEITDDFIKKEFEGDLLEIFQKTFFEIKKTMNIFSYIDGFKRVEIPEYPPQIIREALINAIVHRDYFDATTEIFVKFFSNRIEITNPATFPIENYSFEEIKKSGISKRRNPLIAQFFEKMGLMEQEGRGLTFMKNEAKKHGLPEPTIEAGSKTFKIIFHNISEKSNGFMSSPYKTVRNYENLNERQKEVMELLRKNTNIEISRSDYIRITKTQPKTATRDLANWNTVSTISITYEQ